MLVGLGLRFLSSVGLFAWETSTISIIMVTSSMLAFLLALHPTQKRAIQVATVIMLIATSVTGFMEMPKNVKLLSSPTIDPHTFPMAEKPPLWYVQLHAALWMAPATGCLVNGIGCVQLLWCSPPPRKHLNKLWSRFAKTMLWVGFVYFLFNVIGLATGFTNTRSTVVGAANALVLAMTGVIASYPQLRVKVHTYLAERSGEMKASVAIGALIGARSLEQLLSVAKVRFRCVPLDRVTKEMIRENTPNPELYKLTEPAVLGMADAFISHSWHDNPEEKWAALQEWRADFKKVMAREPLVWFDKFCIDQNNITESLAGLPVYLAGCDYLVVLHGQTYQTRLWCLIELFTFIVMGGDVGNLVVRQLSSCEASFENFDARLATCFKEEDSSHLLGVIEAGLGTVHHFNAVVRSMISARSSWVPYSSSKQVEAFANDEGSGAAFASENNLRSDDETMLDLAVFFMEEGEEMFTI